MKSDRAYLLHIRDAIHRIQRYTESGQTGFLSDERTQDAVIRNLEIIGEAVKQLTPEALEIRPEIPWKRIAGMRDVLIHHYFGVKIDAVWQVVESHLNPLANAVRELLSMKLAGDTDEPDEASDV